MPSEVEMSQLTKVTVFERRATVEPASVEAILVGLPSHVVKVYDAALLDLADCKLFLRELRACTRF